MTILMILSSVHSEMNWGRIKPTTAACKSERIGKMFDKVMYETKIAPFMDHSV